MFSPSSKLLLLPFHKIDFGPSASSCAVIEIRFVILDAHSSGILGGRDMEKADIIVRNFRLGIIARPN